MTLNIWRITDGKSGHDSQSAGLCKAIADLSSSKQFDLTANSLASCLKSFVSRKFPDGDGLPDPDIIIGAGHGTHNNNIWIRQPITIWKFSRYKTL
jgi:hypothetical protein